MSTRLSSLLVQDGLVSAKRVADALQRQVIHGGTLDSNLLDIKAIEEDTLITYLGRACGLPTLPTGIAPSAMPLPAVLEHFTAEIAQRFHAVPTVLQTGGVLRVLVTDEVELSDMDALAATVKQRIEPWVIFEFRFAEAMDKVYGRAMPTRFARLLQRSIAAHDGQGKPWPAPRLIDPIPRFGSPSDLRLSGPPAAEPTAPVAEPAAKPAVAAEAVAAKPAVATPAAAPTAAAVVAEVPAKAAVSAPVAAKPTAEPTSAPAAVVAEVPAKAAVSAPVAVKPAATPAPAAVVAEVPAKAAVSAPVAVKPAAAEAAKEAPPAAVAAPVPTVVETPPAQSAVPTPIIAEAGPVAVAVPIHVAAPPASAIEKTPEAAAKPSAQSVPPRSSTSGPSFAGIEDISLDEWMSAADWLSAANKVPPAEPQSAAATAAAPQSAVPAAAVAQPAPPVAPASAAKPTPQAAPAATDAPTARPTAPVASPPSSASPGKRKGKRNKGKDVPQPVVAAKPSPIVTTPVATAQSKPVAPTAPAKPAPQAAPAAAQSKPAVAPVATAPAKPAPTQPTLPAAAPVTAKPAAPLPGVIAPPPAVEAARPTPAAEPSASEANPVESPRSTEPAAKPTQTAAPTVAAKSSEAPAKPVAAPAVVAPAAPPPSAESPLPEIGPPPRIAVALDESGGAAPISLEAARELVGMATERDPIFEAVCRGVRSRAAFVAVFTIHGDVAFGRIALGDDWLDRQMVGRVSVQLDRTSAFRAVAKGRLPFVGFVGEEEAASDPLRALSRKPPQAAAVMPILVRGKPVALIYFDDDGREVSTALAEELQPLISEIGQSFQRFVQSSKSGGLGASEGDEPAPQEVQDAATSALRPRESRIETAAPKPIEGQATTRLQPTAEPAAPTLPLSAQETVPLAKAGPVTAPEKPEAKPEAKLEPKVETKPESKPEARGKAGRGGRGQKGQQPASAASPPSATKGAIATTDLSALLDKAAAAPRDQAALRDIVIVGQAAVKPLIDRLKDPTSSSRLRLIIVQCLAEMPVPQALEPLGERLFDSEEEVRTAAAGALRNFPPSAALSTLRSRLRDALDGGDAKGVQHAVEALGELRDTPAVQQLIDLLDHRDARVVDAVGRALQNITKQDFGRSRFRFSGWWRRHQSEPRLQWLLAGLCHPSALIRSSSQDELFEMSGDVASYRYDQPSSERDQAARRWVDWWQAHGYDVI